MIIPRMPDPLQQPQHQPQSPMAPGSPASAMPNPFTPPPTAPTAAPAAAARSPRAPVAQPASRPSPAPAQPTQQRPAAPDHIMRGRAAIRAIETGGQRDPYRTQGPVLTKGRYAGDRPLGAYQVMGRNIPEWTKEAFGTAMTKEQFLADDRAQDALFDYKFGQYVARYGSVQDAASVWFTGQPYNPSSAQRSDGHITNTEYVRRFMAAYDGNPSAAYRATDGGKRMPGDPWLTGADPSRPIPVLSPEYQAKAEAMVAQIKAAAAGKRDPVGAALTGINRVAASAAPAPVLEEPEVPQAPTRQPARQTRRRVAQAQRGKPQPDKQRPGPRNPLPRVPNSV